MYTCGPTVYNHAHIGNFRAYLFEDLLQRHLELRDFKVHRVMNITDVDDKTIQGSRSAGVPLAEFTSPFKRRHSSKTWRLFESSAHQFLSRSDRSEARSQP